jgi:methylmalonyl-CoA mutase N-terminal domain/subunit
VIAHASGITAEPDPLGGSYFVEQLTLDIEAAANAYIRRIDEMGGMIHASYGFQRSVEMGESVIVGVNKYTEKEEKPIELLQIDRSAEVRQVEKLRGVKARRSSEAVAKALANLKRAAEGTENTMPFIIEAVKAYATVGEISATFGEVFGSYTETSVL